MNKINDLNSVKIGSNGQQPKKSRGEPATKVYDVTSFSGSVSTVPSVTAVSNWPNGTGVNQRTGDCSFFRKMFLNYGIATQNADIYSTVRVMVVQWHPNTSLVVCAASSVLQNATNIFSMYDWNLSSQFTVLYDRIHFLSGLATAPTNSGYQGFSGEIDLSRGRKRIEFANGLTTGSEQIFIILLSDSSIAPYPVLTGWSRITFCDE